MTFTTQQLDEIANEIATNIDLTQPINPAKVEAQKALQNSYAFSSQVAASKIIAEILPYELAVAPVVAASMMLGIEIGFHLAESQKINNEVEKILRS